MQLKVGTRGSKLALAQCKQVTDRINADVETVTVTTTGDRLRGAVTDKAKWVSELEQALLDRRVDIAVHSAKDVPTELPAEFELIGVPLKADSRDALCGNYSFAELPEGATVGTASLRRRSQLLSLRPDLKIKPLHGNIDTRLTKLSEGEYDAILLAAAGLERLGVSQEIAELLECEQFVPAAGQGALVIEVLKDRTDELRQHLNIDTQATQLLTIEREMLALLDADCDSPIGLHAGSDQDGAISVTSYVGRADGSEWLRDSVKLVGASTNEVAKQAFSRLQSLEVKALLH